MGRWSYKRASPQQQEHSIVIQQVSLLLLLLLLISLQMAGRVGGLTAGPHNKEKLNNVRALTSEEARYLGCHNMFRSGLILIYLDLDSHPHYHYIQCNLLLS